MGYALARHPLCRNVQFDIVSVPRTSRGGNWTISLQAVEPRALWEASDIVADIQAAYDLPRRPDFRRFRLVFPVFFVSRGTVKP